MIAQRAGSRSHAAPVSYTHLDVYKRQHLHFGDGSIETELALTPGEHTLCLQAADGAHTALPGEGMTHTISITVP